MILKPNPTTHTTRRAFPLETCDLRCTTTRTVNAAIIGTQPRDFADRSRDPQLNMRRLNPLVLSSGANDDTDPNSHPGGMLSLCVSPQKFDVCRIVGTSHSCTTSASAPVTCYPPGSCPSSVALASTSAWAVC